MNRYLVALLALLWAWSAVAEDRVLASLFSRYGVSGTIVLASLHGGQTFIHDDHRAHRRLSPASTFKIPNTLIALEEKAISGADGELKWDGHHYDFPDWNRDQTLESAFKVSCVWCYQVLARRVGAEKYRGWLRRCSYGELREPFNETTFWLDGALKISAVEQVAFLKALVLRKLPFSASSYDTLRRIMLAERTPSYAVWAKTGWAARVKPQVGWYVGYVEAGSEVWLFATNIDVRGERDLPLRKELTYAALRARGIIPQ
ncbi:MAG: class D beta-lactamase [Methylotetracoccus sp.]